MIARSLAPRTISRSGLPRAFRSYSVKFSENFGQQESKPKISEFKNPLFHTFLIASGTFMALNAVWFTLEYETVEKDLKAESARLEEQLQQALGEAKQEMVSSNSKKWYSKFAFWKS